MAHLRSYTNSGTIAKKSGAVAAAFRTRAAEWELPIVEDDDRLSVFLWGCEMRLRSETDHLRIDLSGPEKRMVDTLRESASELVNEVGLSIAWEHLDVGALAPGLSLMRVLRVTQISPGFLRVRLTAPDAARFGSGNLHFRLLLPPPGRDPVWPRVTRQGRTEWPTGDDALHRPIYTTAAQADSWLDFDVVRHAGSPTCDWALSNPIGQEVAIVGPGGGGSPEADRLWLFGDATAVPAIARILQLARGEVNAVVACAAEDAAQLLDDPRVTRTDDLLDAFRAHHRFDDGDFVWFAGSVDQAKMARQHLSALGIAKQRFLVAAYWA